MSWRATAWAKTFRTGSPSRKAVLMVLAEHADLWAYALAGEAAIAEEAELSERQVRRIVQALAGLGAVEIWQARGATGQRHNLYRLLLDVPAKEPMPDTHPIRSGRFTLVNVAGTEREPPDNMSGGPPDMEGRPTGHGGSGHRTPEVEPPDIAVSGITTSTGLSTTGTGRARETLLRVREAYPDRLGDDPDGPALEQIEALLAEGIEPDRLVAAAAARRQLAIEAGENGTRFVPTLARWLGERRFEAHAAAPETVPAAPAVPMPVEAPDADGRWRRVRGRLRSQHGEAAFKVWIRPLRWQGVIDGRPVLVCPSDGIRDGLAARAGDDLARHLGDEGLAAPALVTAAEWAGGAWAAP